MKNEFYVNIISYSIASNWIKHSVVSNIIQKSLNEHYGFNPINMFINDNSKGYQIEKYLPKLLERITSGNIRLLDICASTQDDPPKINMSISRFPMGPCRMSLLLPFSHELSSKKSETERLLLLTERLIEDSQPEYLFGHEERDWRKIHNERHGHLLMINSENRGAYWLSYFCNEYVNRLGGIAKLKKAPAWKIKELSNGILVISHNDPSDLDKEQKKNDIAKLHDYFKSLVKEKERP